MYVPQLILLNDGPVTMTTMKLNVQFDAVLNALAGARIRSPTISAGCVQQHHRQLLATKTPMDHGRSTYVEPGHAKPSDGEERVKHEEKHC